MDFKPDSSSAEKNLELLSLKIIKSCESINEERTNIEADDIERVYLSYIDDFNSINKLPNNIKKFEAFLNLYIDIGDRHDPSQYDKHVWNIADLLKTSYYDEERKENPPFNSIKEFDYYPEHKIVFTRARMLILFWQIEHWLIWYGRFRLPHRHKKATGSKGKASRPIKWHFDVCDNNQAIIRILKQLKEAKWIHNRLEDEGLVSNSITDKEWLYVLKGIGSPIKRKLPWKAKFACKSFVKQYLNSDYETAEQVFCSASGEDFYDLLHCNISKNDVICNEKTGLIAQIIRESMRTMD